LLFFWGVCVGGCVGGLGGGGKKLREVRWDRGNTKRKRRGRETGEPVFEKKKGKSKKRRGGS